MRSDSLVQHIDAVDAYARTLFVRAQQSPFPAIASDVTQGVQQLHLALRHLRIQAADPGDSDDDGGYSRRLKLRVEGSESALKLLEHVLERHGAMGGFAIDGEADGVAAVKAKLAREKGAIEEFLDRVQLGKASGDDADDGGATQGLLLDHDDSVSSSRPKSMDTSSDKSGQRRPALEEKPITPLQKQFSYDRHSISMSSAELASEISDSLKIISTMDLIQLDSPIDDVSQLHQQQKAARSRGASLTLPQNAASPRSLPSGGNFELSWSSGSHSATPRSFSQSQSSFRGSGSYGSNARPFLHLAPDSHGRDIPMDAPWTKIKRTLVSPEVLHRAGLRYEARPDYVAVLGRLDRDQIAHYARLSAECRAARMGKPPPAAHRQGYRYSRRSSHRHDDEGDTSDSDSSHTSEDEDDRQSDKRTKSYPVIVDPPAKKQTVTSPASTVLPKPILKNKTSSHFRSNSEPHGISESYQPESYQSGREDHDRRHDRRHDRDDRYKDDSSRRREGGDRRRRGDRDGYSRGDGHRDRDDDDDYHHHHGSGHHHKRSERRSRTRSWGETLGKVGIGGAAMSLLGILAEAAAGS